MDKETQSLLHNARACLKQALPILSSASRIGQAEAKKKGLDGAAYVYQWALDAVRNIEVALNKPGDG